MTAYELCQRNVVTVRRHEELVTAAWMMRERNVGCLVVVEPAGGIHGGERPVGTLTDRDIVTAVIAADKDPRDLLVDDVMTRHPITVPSNAGVEEALLRMRVGGVRRVPLLDERGRLAGILALDDVYEHFAQRGAAFVTPIRRESRAEQNA